MTWQSGTATGVVPFLDDLLQILENSSVDSLAVNAGGSGYAVGDTFQVNGGTALGGHVAKGEVLAVSSGAVTSVRIEEGGAYTANPGTAATTTALTGAGTGLTVDTTIASNRWTLRRRSQEAVSATEEGTTGDGAGYTNGDVVTVVGGLAETDGGAAPTFTLTVSGGNVTGVALASAGNLSELPANPVSVTGGTGTGLQLNVTWQDSTSDDDQVIILEGGGLSGTDNIYVGLKLYSEANGFDTAHNIALYGFTGYNSGLPFEEQPGVSPGILTTGGTKGQVDSVDMALVPAKVAADLGGDIDWWVKANGRRFMFFLKVEDGTNTNYMHAHLGLLNQAGTQGEYPYPLWISGSTNVSNTLFNDVTNLIGGLSQVVSRQSNTGANNNPEGTAFLRLPDGSWESHASAKSSSSSVHAIEDSFGVLPLFVPTTENSATDGSLVTNTGFAPDELFPDGPAATPDILLKPTPNSSAVDQYLFLPVVPVTNVAPSLTGPAVQYGEVDEVFWFHTGNNAVVSEDTFDIGDDRYLILQNGNRTQVWSYCAIKKS